MLKQGLAVLLLAAALGAQTAEFERAYAEAERLRQEGAAPASVRAAYARAVRCFLQIEDRDERDARRAAGAFSALQAGQHDLAVALFEEAAAAGQRDATLCGWHLQALLAAGRDEHALRLGQAEQARFPSAVRDVLGTAASVLAAADQLLRRGETELALWAFRLQAEARPDDAPALANLALALRHAGREADSEAIYRTALAMSPQDGLLWNDFGLFLLGTGRRDEAVRAFQQSVACETDPAESAAIVNLAQLDLGFRHRGEEIRPEQALAMLLRARPDAAGGLGRRLLLDRLCRQRPADKPSRGE